VIANPYAPQITNLKVNTLSGVANGKVTLMATIVTTSPIDDIEVEFHGDKEYDVDIYGYKGQSGKITFTKDVTIPANCLPGTYHLQFKVKVSKGLETIEEIDGFVIK